MSALQAPPPPPDDVQAHSPSGLMPEPGDGHDEPSQQPALAPHEQARTLVRLIQCPHCSRPYRTPVTLPCGRSLCRACLPDSHDRDRVSWPDLPDRNSAITCPYPSCGLEHVLADCKIDVVLYKLIEAVDELVAKQNSLTSLGELENHVSNGPTHAERMDVGSQVEIRSKGRLVATYNAAASGQLDYHADISYESATGDLDDDKTTDELVLASLMDACQKELDCQVCYNLMLDPVTTPCGHTLCRKCLARSLDHSLHCPVCRRVVLIRPPSLCGYPSNKTLGDILDGVCPDLVAARKEATATEDAAPLGDFDVPLFVVTLGFPGCATFLRVFEPRYKLMLRRALEGNRTFGMVMYNQSGALQGELGQSHFMQYGTLLHIEHAQLMPDGTSLIETKGISRFKVISSGMLDGYAVGRIEKVEDMSLADEEALEARETSLAPVEETDVEGSIQRMPTRQMLDVGLGFITKMQERSAPWLNEGILQAYGGPPSDASIFPYWFASILPINDQAKYALLQTTSVRERLKITVRWVKLMESQRWYRSNACTVL